MTISPSDESNRQGDSRRLIAFSIIILSGNESGFGLVVLLAGILLTAGELYLMGFFKELRDAVFRPRAETRRGESNPLPPPPGD